MLEKRLRRPIEPVFQISATERLLNRGPERDWGKLLGGLDQLGRDSGRQVIRAACERGVQRLREQLLAIINEERAALEWPIEKSERRIAAVKETIAEAGRSMRELSFLILDTNVGYAFTSHLTGDVGIPVFFVRSHFSMVGSQDWRWTTWLLAEPYVDVR